MFKRGHLVVLLHQKKREIESHQTRHDFDELAGNREKGEEACKREDHKKRHRVTTVQVIARIPSKESRRTAAPVSVVLTA